MTRPVTGSGARSWRPAELAIRSWCRAAVSALPDQRIRELIHVLLDVRVAAGLASLGATRAFAQDPAKPAAIIIRAWGGVWVDSLKAGVSDPFTAMTGIPVRHDLTEDNEIQPKVWAAVEQGRVPPIHINWDTTVNATKSAARRHEDSRYSKSRRVLPFAKPKGGRVRSQNLRLFMARIRDEAFPTGPPLWNVLSTRSSRGVRTIRHRMHFPAVMPGAEVRGHPENMQPAWDWFPS